MPLALGIGIGITFGGSNSSGALALAGTNTDVLAASVNDNSLIIRDTVTPAHNYNGQLYDPVAGTFNKGTFARATIAYEMVNGILTQFASGKPRFKQASGVTSFTIEPAATNLCLRCRDWTNAAWVKVNMGAALNATGPDNTANAATTITASAGLATILQTITTTTTDVFSVWVKRITGSGTIEITQNGGTAWTAIVPTASWTRFAIPAAALVNPVVGVRITTNGDAVAVDFAQLETNGFATSNILTTAASATRNADDYTIAGTSFNISATVGTIYSMSSLNGLTASLEQDPVALSDGGSNNAVWTSVTDGFGETSCPVRTASVLQANIVVALTPVLGQFYKIAHAFALNDVRAARDTTFGTQDTVATIPATLNTLTIGSFLGFGYLNGNIKEFMYVARSYTNGEITALTT